MKPFADTSPIKTSTPFLAHCCDNIEKLVSGATNLPSSPMCAAEFAVPTDLDEHHGASTVMRDGPFFKILSCGSNPNAIGTVVQHLIELGANTVVVAREVGTVVHGEDVIRPGDAVEMWCVTDSEGFHALGVSKEVGVISEWHVTEDSSLQIQIASKCEIMPDGFWVDLNR